MKPITQKLINILIFIFLHEMSCMALTNICYVRLMDIMTVIVIAYELRDIYRIMKNKEE